MKNIIKKTFEKFGYTISKIEYGLDSVMEKDVVFQKIYIKCKDYTVTSRERMYALFKAIEYAANSKIQGDFVECGVFRGGSSMLIALTLLEMKDTTRKIYLYDTFEGMAEPTKEDVLVGDKSVCALSEWKKGLGGGGTNKWCLCSESVVKNNLYLTGYPKNKLVFIKGKVEETITKTMPSEIALLRLDTDWYGSTKHELIHMFPLVVRGGILIIDDYGWWAGSKKAVDEYFCNKPIFLNRIDRSGRLGIKIF